jgi:hypothetical protein
MSRIEDIDAAHVAAIRTDESRIRADCGHMTLPDLFPVPEWRDLAGTPGTGITGGTGYSTDSDGFTRCYPCSDTAEREQMKTADRVFGYLSADNRSVTTWTGGILARVTSHHVSKPARKTYVRAVDPDGVVWSGTGPSESGTYVNLRRRKARS